MSTDFQMKAHYKDSTAEEVKWHRAYL